MSSTKTWQRSQSLPPRALLDHPQPARDTPTRHDALDGGGGGAPASSTATGTNSNTSNRSAVPRAVSIPNLQKAVVGGAFLDMRDSMVETDEEAMFRDIAREQIDAATLRDLVRFFRTTEPPSRAPSFDVGNDCLGTPTAMLRDKRRWSIQSLRKGRKGRTSSLQLQLPDTAVPKTTTGGHAYIAISVPGSPAVGRRLNGDERRLSQLRLSIPRHVRFSGLSIPSLSIPDELEWLQESNAKREAAVVGTQTSPQGDDGPASPTITITPLGPEPMTPLTALSSHPPVFFREPSPLSSSVDSESRDTPSHSSPDGMNLLRSPSTSPISPITIESPRPSSSSSAPPKLLAHRRQLSAFPRTTTTPPPGSASPRSTSPRPMSPMSPKQQQQQQQTNKKPASIVVKPRLEVPATNQQPDSPGFPMLLAAMTFPSPPETSSIHSASNSISSIDPMRSASPSSTKSARSPSRAMLESSLDQRMMQKQDKQRPPLRKYRSDGGPQIAFVSQKSVASSIGTLHSGSPEPAPVAQTAQVYGQPPAESIQGNMAGSDTGDTDSSGDKSKSNLDLAVSTPVDASDEVQARSSASTTDSYQYETASESYRHSLRSDTTETSISTTRSLRGMERETSSRRDSSTYSNSMDILNRKRSGRPRAPWSESTSRDESVEGDRKAMDSERSSIMSASSSSTVKTSTTQSSMADRRLARKAKIREKFQKDLNATKANNLRLSLNDDPATATVFMDSVDSPVLGRFPQTASGPSPATLPVRRTSVQGRSPLAAKTAAEYEDPVILTRHVARRSSVHDIAQLIPHTVPEDVGPNSPNSPTTPRANASTVAEDDVESGKIDPSPALTMSPVMIVANIEAISPSTPVTTAALRPLSLLSTGLSPPIPPPRLAIRAESKANARQRPLPIKIATAKSTRKSVPNMPTPPLTADSPSSLRRMSLPIQKNTPSNNPAQNSTNPWNRPSLIANADSSLVTRDRETQWLLAHQRETAQEWRMAALRERMRLERLAEEQEEADLSDTTSEVPNERDESTEGHDKVEVTRSLRERNSSRSIASSTTKENNRMNTLDLLNTNATDEEETAVPSDTGGVEDAKSHATHAPEDPSQTTDIDGSIKERLERLEKNGEAWVGVVMPLLQDMSRMLKDLRRESAGQDMTIKLMESALAAGLGTTGAPTGGAAPVKQETQRPASLDAQGSLAGGEEGTGVGEEVQATDSVKN